MINCYTQHLCDVQIYVLLIHFLHACITVELYPNYICISITKQLIYFSVVQNMQLVALDGQNFEMLRFPQICTERNSSVVHCGIVIPVDGPSYLNALIGNIRYVGTYVLLLKGKE